MTFGIGTSWIAPLLTSLRKSNSEFTLTIEDCSWIGSFMFIGRMLGPIIIIPIDDIMGCREILVLGFLNLLLSWIILIFTRTIFMLIVSRFIFGLALGIIDIPYPIYISENCSPNMRGIFTSLLMLFYYFGFTLGYALPGFFSYSTTLNVNATFGIIAVISTLLLKEPAQYLTAKGKYDKAEKNFFWLRECNDATRKEFDEIKKYVLEKSKFPFKLLFCNKINRKTFSIVFFLSFLTTASGMPAITVAITFLLSQMGESRSNQLSILFGLVQFFSVFLFSFFAEKFDRRKLFLFSSLISGLVHFISGTLYCIHQNILQVPYFNIFILITICIYSIIFGTIFLPLFIIIRGELLHQNIKIIGGCLTMVMQSAISFAQIKLFFIVAEKYGIQVNFFIYSIVSFILVVFVYFQLPETRGLSLVEIQKSLENLK
ncbi:hypothetical protein PGB90_001399 [Kerria lacca]